MKYRFQLSLLILIALASLYPNACSAREPVPAPVPVSPAPVSNLVASDHPNDTGHEVDVSWNLSADDPPAEVVVKTKPADEKPAATDADDSEPRKVTGYRIERQSEQDPGWILLETLDYGSSTYADERAHPNKKYRYRVTALGPVGAESEAVTMQDFIQPKLEWFDRSQGWFAALLVLICSCVVGFILYARSGADLKIRKIAGLDVVDEAVGRATEMGRSCLFVPGILDLNDIQTISGLTILGRVAETAAVYDCPVEVPTSKSLVMTAAQETVASSYMTAGVPDAFNPNTVYYVTDEQFGYVAYLSGMMVRDEPAACFYMGAFFAESLVLAETGNSIGAIQVAGTAQPSQLPFFVAACDYTLIGEEFFAASAYLSGEPDQLGSLKGQDMGKLLAGLLILVGCLLATLAAVSVEGSAVSQVFDYLKYRILSGGGA